MTTKSALAGHTDVEIQVNIQSKCIGASLMESSPGCLDQIYGETLENQHFQDVNHEDMEELFNLHACEWIGLEHFQEEVVDASNSWPSPTLDNVEMDSNELSAPAFERRSIPWSDMLHMPPPSVSSPLSTPRSVSKLPLSSSSSFTPCGLSPPSLQSGIRAIEGGVGQTQQRKRSQSTQNCPPESSSTDRQQARVRRKIEKKYRSKLAINLDRLRASVPSLLTKGEERPDDEELFGLSTTQKRSKATTISKAVEYIDRIKEQYRVATERAARAELELAALKAQKERLRPGSSNSQSANLDMLEYRLLASVDWFRKTAHDTRVHQQCFLHEAG
nr:hypothetical protein CFP56_72365 [Quercus suber]